LAKGGNEIDIKVFGQNIKKGSQKFFGHPLTLEAFLHVKHPCLTCLVRRKKNETNPN
jgi:hypothetical protein